MRPVLRPAILALTLTMVVSAAAAETRKERSIPPGKKTAASTTTVAKPLKITPARRNAVPHTHIVQPKATTARAKPEGLAASRVKRKPLVLKHVVKAQRLRATISSRPASTSSEANAFAIAGAPIALTLAQKYAIYRTIAEIPLQPRLVPTQRVLPPPANLPSLEPPTSTALPRTAITESEPVVGARLPSTATLHQIPLSAVEAVPEIAPYHYAFVGDRVLLVDPVSGIVVAAIKRE